MTVSYQYDVASSASGGFIRLLFRWKGSVWKVVYREMFIFTVCYCALEILYHFVLTESQQRIFERVVFFCSTFMDLIPLSFMLGFYVSFIAARWWSQFTAIPWPDKLMNIIAMYVPGFDEDSRVVRRTLMRYLNLSLVLVLRSISMAVKRRFPTKEHLIEAGFMTKTELEMFQSVPSTEFNTFWIPCTWFINVLRAARQECRITDSNGLKLIMEELNEFRSKCGLLWGYDWISIPLVYTQVVTMATYAFYVACMFGRQNVKLMTDKASSPEVHRYDYYIPIFTILQLMFYMGLLKVAEQLINPFGDDDEDFELNWIIDRHMKVSYLGVDTLNSEPPPLVKDTYYNELDVKIPYTEASKSYKKKTYRGSVAYMQVPMDKQGMVVPDMSEDEDDGETASETMGPRRPSVYTLFATRGKSGSFSNLDSRSIGSIDSLWKSSLPNLSTTKNASGTLGDIEQQWMENDIDTTEQLHNNQVPPLVVDMAKAEDDEIVLQEVIIDKTNVGKPIVQQPDGLQIPGASSNGSKKEPALSRRRLSPKIAPKFPREKLKSMFRKRKLSSAFPFYKLKGVRFTRETKEDSGSIHQSLLDVTGHEAMDVEITLSTPELTEIEKETGVHPYYYTQQTITSVKQLATGQALAMRQPSLTRSESEEKMFKGHRMGRYLVRSNSLPNISHPDEYAHYIHDPIIESSLKKISEAMKNKEKVKKSKTKKKSPPPKTIQQKDESVGDAPDSEIPSDTESVARSNTVPQITLTRCGQKAQEHLDLATSTKTEQSRDRDSETKTTESQGKRDSIPHDDKQPQSPRTSQHSITGILSQKEEVETSPEPHSTSKKQTSSPPHPIIVTPPQHATIVTPPQHATMVMPSQHAPSVTPSQHAPSITPSQHAPSVTPSQHAPSITPSQHAPSVTPSQHAPSVTPSQHAPSVTPSQQAPSVTPSHHAPNVTPSQHAPNVTPSQHAPSVTPSQHATIITPSQYAATVTPDTKREPVRKKSPPPPSIKRKSPPPPSMKRKSPPPVRRKSPPPMRRKSPPPKGPEKLMFTKYTPTKKIAGISLKSDLPPPSPTESSPSSPISDIPSTIIPGRTPSIPKITASTQAASKSPTHTTTTEVTPSSSRYPIVRADTTVTISDSKEDLTQIVTDKSCPPEPPQRHIPRSTGKGKK